MLEQSMPRLMQKLMEGVTQERERVCVVLLLLALLGEDTTPG